MSEEESYRAEHSQMQSLQKQIEEERGSEWRKTHTWMQKSLEGEMYSANLYDQMIILVSTPEDGKTVRRAGRLMP